MKLSKRILALVLCTAMALGATACGKPAASGSASTATPAASGSTAAAGDDSNLNPVGTFPIVKTPEEYTIFSITAPNVEDMETNDFTKFYEEKTGIKIKWELATRDNWKEKLNLALSTNDYPDAIMWFSPDLPKYGVKEGVFIQLDDLIEENMPNYVKMLGDSINTTRQTDGHIYSVGGVNECYHCMYAKKMWVNTMWLEKMDMEVPTTTEEFYNVCKKFLEINPKGIAIGGTVPGKGWHSSFEEFLLNSFTLAQAGSQSFNDWTVVDGSGKVITTANTEAYKEGVAWLKELYDLGAIYEGDFTQTEEQLKTLVNQPDEPVLFLSTGTISNHIDAVANNELYGHYEVMSPLKGPKGVQNATYMKYSGVSDGGGLVITDKCENPAALLRWADWFYTTEGSLSSQFGAEEGKDWVLAPEGKVGLNGEPALYEILNIYSAEPQNHDWQDVGMPARPNDFRLGSATDADVDMKSADGLEALLYYSSKEKMEPYAQDPTVMDVLPGLKFTDEETTSIQTIGVEVAKSIAENRVAFITGKRDLDKEWDAYVKELDSMGLQTLLEVYQAAYDRQMKQ